MSRSLRIGSFLSAAALLCVAPLFAAQDKSTEKPRNPPPAAQGEKKPVPASAPAAPAAQAKFTIPVTGLTADNAGKVQTSLAALSHTAWTCPACKMVADEAGQCPQCKKELTSAPQKSLADVKADTAGGTIHAMLSPGAMVKLSDVERALGGASVKLDPAKLTLAGHTKLIVQGPGDAATAKKLEEGLKAAKIFDTVEIKHDADSREYVIAAQAGATAPTKEATASALTRAGGENFKLVDVVWIGPKRVS